MTIVKFFNQQSPYFTDDPETNLWYLKNVENLANRGLNVKGVIFLSEIYSSLGLPVTRESVVAGWYDDPNDSGYHRIHFGIEDTCGPAGIKVIFKCEENILDHLPKELGE